MSVSMSAVSTYLSIIKDESAQADKFAQSDATTRNILAQANKQAPKITSPVGLLDNYAALQVVLGAEGMGGAIGETGLLKQLLTQNPASSNSLVQRLASVTDFHFATAMQNRNTLQIALGNPSNLSFTTGGASAATIRVQTANYDTGPSTQSATSVARQWNYVLNDGTAGKTIATALANAAGGNARYSVSPNGVVTAASGAPAVTTTTNPDGSTTYAIAAATDSSGHTTRQINIVSVPVSAGTGAAAAGAPINALVAAMNGTGLAATSNGGTLSITGSTSIDTTGLPSLITTTASAVPAGSATLALGSNATSLTAGMVIRDGSTVIGEVSSVDTDGNVTLSGASEAAIAAGDQLTVSNGITASFTATSGTVTSSTVLALGGGISGANPGQIIYDNGKLVGTIASIDRAGNVTLTEAAGTPISSGDTLTVAVGAAITGVTQGATTTVAVAAGQSKIALGSAGTGLQPGQLLSLGSVKIGTVKSVDGNGNVTLTGVTPTAISQGAALTVSGGLTQTSTPALSDAANLASIENSYRISQYEANEGRQVAGMDTALYFTRVAPSITTMDELMTDTNMLKVVSSSLGYEWTTFGGMSYDQQVNILTKGVKLSDFQDPKKVQTLCEQYLTLNSDGSGVSNPLLSLFGDGGDGNSILSALLGGGGSGSSTNSITNSTLALFA